MPADRLGGMTRVAVLGAKGRMGSESVRALGAADGIEVVAEIDVDDSLDLVADVRSRGRARLHPAGRGPRQRARGASSTASTSWSARRASTTPRSTAVRALLGDAPSTGVLIVPNFSIGAVLMMRFAATAAPFFESIEVIELHHPDKVDAPSGTATRTAEMIAAARAEAGSPAAARCHDDGSRRRAWGDRRRHPGARGACPRVHGVSQEVAVRGAGETFSIRHDSDRPGFLHARRRRRRTRRLGPPGPHRGPRRRPRPLSTVGSPEPDGLTATRGQVCVGGRLLQARGKPSEQADEGGDQRGGEHHRQERHAQRQQHRRDDQPQQPCVDAERSVVGEHLHRDQGAQQRRRGSGRRRAWSSGGRAPARAPTARHT